MTSAAMIDPAGLDARREYYERIDRHHLTPLWEVLGTLVPPTPRSPAQAALWRYNQARAYLLEAGGLISAHEAERRVLVLENPGLRGQSRITQSLYAGLQLILPGEVAPAHRHTQSALRLVLEGEGAYTAVDGERTTMRRGDFIITPAWTFHDHGNSGTQPVIWLDGLDIPIVQLLDAGFAEKSAQDEQAVIRREGDALARYGYNMLPVDFEPQRQDPTKVFVYPYARTREALRGIASGDIDPHHGYKLRYVNPATGGSPMPTIGAAAQLLPAGFETRGCRSTDSSIFVCLQGGGAARIGETELSFGENDVFVVPSWNELHLQVTCETILFSYSDRPVQRLLGLWREQKA
ncbi:MULTISPECIES: gentisate 1,2-dioxygenase [Hydrocarboniphaga]|nr:MULTISPECIES: gentisate 1,2-dioxygenase [Hydrocarboniphaga]MDZ4078035.1 gentisate 1,2-dioxygenase [Hydrocarboniphaga sp.]